MIVSGNFKGGTGKTSTAAMLGIVLAKLDKRALLIDLDPQGNATDLYFKIKQNVTDKVVPFNLTLMKSIDKDDITLAVVKLDKNIDFIPSSVDFSYFPRFMEKKYTNYIDRVQYLNELIEPLKERYDFIILDLPPTIGLITDSALYAADWAIIVLQIQERSLQGAEGFVKYMQETVINEYHAPRLQVAGVLPVLLKEAAAVDRMTTADLKKVNKEHNKEAPTIQKVTSDVTFSSSIRVDNHIKNKLQAMSIIGLATNAIDTLFDSWFEGLNGLFFTPYESAIIIDSVEFI